MTKPDRPKILGVPFDFVSPIQAFDTIESWRRNGERGYVTFINPFGVMASRRDPEVAKATSGADLALPDGIGIVIAGKMSRYKNVARVPGPSFMLKLCDWGRQHGYRHFFYGGAEGQPEKLADMLREKYPGLTVAGTLATPFSAKPRDDGEVTAEINAARPDVVWVGIGSPRQEKWMASHVGRIGAAAMLGVGAAFDFHCGRVAWAPPWVRRTGFEWAYRLMQEPRRLWKRTLVDSPVFLAAAVGEAIFGSK